MNKFEWKCDQLFQELLNRGTIIHGTSSFVNMNHTYAFLKENFVKHNTPIEVTTNQAFKKFKLSTLYIRFVVESFQGQMTCNKPKWLLQLLISISLLFRH